MITQYIATKSSIHNLDPRTKLIWLFIMYTVVLFFDHPVFLTIFFIYILLIYSIANIPGRTIWASIKPFTILAIFIVLIWVIIFPGTKVIFRIPYINFPISLESIMHATSMAIRFLSLLSATFLLLFTTKISELTIGFRKFGLPYTASFLFAGSIRFIPVIMDDLNTIMEAQKCRGLDLESGSLLSRAKSIIIMLAPLIFTSFKRVKTLGYSLETRAFDAVNKRTSLIEIKFKSTDYLVILLNILLLIVCIFLRLEGYGIVA